ncbi:hypothetical protein CONLIGDRAFT_281864 [Coniochaeta ligniaria NRRL 30616]|uniref:Myb-like domain-containing protein n=1 Tax=Coniochaeta ligniaria NRRL 30616 TaxID=1408157 RepID=A0A1J7JKY2_9PEZI|nr:hypothetical protein CONLIGDRAFT_281864 [Coniochaeta ligniaria NRRL 30616]
MTGRGRSTRAGTRAEPAGAVSPQRRATRQTPAAEDEAAMPPPPTPNTRVGRVTRGQSKDVEAVNVPPPRFGAPRIPSSQVGSIGSFPTQVTQEDDGESEAAEDAALTEQLRGSEVPVTESGSQGTVLLGDDGASQYRDSQDRFSQSRRFDSTPGRSDAYVTTPGGPRAKARILLRMMDHLYGYADAVQELLYNHVNDPAWELEYNKWFKFFTQTLDEYQQDGFFISGATVIASLDVAPDHPTAFKASRTVAMANIASLLADIHSIDQRGWDWPGLLSYVQAWDEAFPSKFLPRREPNQPLWMEQSEIIGLALRLRIQRTIYTLEDSEREAEPMSLMDAIWIDPKGLTPRHELLAFLSGNDDEGIIELKKTLAGVSLNDERYTELRNQYIAQVRLLYSAAASGHLPSAVAELKRQFPIKPLMEQLQKWCFVLFRQIIKVVDPARGTTEILQKRRELMPSSVYPAPSDFGYSQSSPTPAQQIAGMQFAHSAAVAAGSPYAAPAASLKALGKRPRDTQDSDDPFETDGRQDNNQRRVQVAETPRPRKRARKTAAVLAASGTDGEGSQTPRRPPPASATDPDLEALSQRAREVAVASRKPKEPQSRTPWSRNDCKALIRAVDVYKAKWSLMAQEIAKGVIPFEHPRDQQALRDKARLLKQDMLKADACLSPGFDLVVLGKKERQAVIACGKNPDRKEADIDDDDQPTNTVYVGDEQ